MTTEHVSSEVLSEWTCRSIRIENYIATPNAYVGQRGLLVSQTSKGIFFNVPHCITGASTTVDIPYCSTLVAKVCYGGLNCVFLKTTSVCGTAIRNQLGVEYAADSNISKNVCPIDIDGDPTQMLITFVMEGKVSKLVQGIIWQSYKPGVEKLTQKRGHDLLMKIREHYSVNNTIGDDQRENRNPILVTPAASPARSLSSTISNKSIGSQLFAPGISSPVHETPFKTAFNPNSPSRTRAVRNKKQKSTTRVHIVKDIMSAAFIQNFVEPSLVKFEIVYEENGMAHVQFTHHI